MPTNYLIIGDDKYIREREVQKLLDRSLPQGDPRALNFSEHTPDNIEKLLDSASTAPFLAEKRVVLLKDADQMKEKDAEPLAAYLAGPCPTTVLLVSAGDAFRKTAAFRKISGSMQVIDASRPGPATLKKWIRSFFQNENTAISDDAVDLIIELKGDDTAAVREELEKLANYSAGERIDAAAVSELVGRSVTETVFKLADAISARNAAWAFRVLEDLYGQRKQPTEIIGYLAWYMRTKAESRGYTRKRIAKWTSRLLETDREIKTGFKDGKLAVEMLLAEMVISSR